MNILIFGGTGEARRLSGNLIKKGIAHTLSVATGYGEQILKEKSPLRKVLTGRLDEKGISELITSGDYDLIIDATHPYATEVSENIIKAADKRVIRLIRDEDEGVKRKICSYERAYCYSGAAKAAEALKDTRGNILITTGSKDLRTFTEAIKSGRDRLYVRVIPGIESIRVCEDAGIETSHIIAMQGPFCRTLNEALIRQFDIEHIVTKDSGRAGGFAEKAEAAMECGIALHIISRPAENPDTEKAGFQEVLDIICAGAEKSGGGEKDIPEILPENEKKDRVNISLIGMGMGSPENITAEAAGIIKNAGLILGSKRLTDICREHFPGESTEYVSEYRPGETADLIEDYMRRSVIGGTERQVAVLFSGDSGLYSGCKSLYEALKKRSGDGLNADIRIYPGISSVSYLSARLKRPYENAFISSVHGRGKESIYRAASHVRICHDVFLLTGGWEDITSLAGILSEAGMGDCIITAAADLSSDKERMIRDSAESFASGAVLNKAYGRSLFTCHIYNPAPVKRSVAAGLKDSEFIRGRVPMTKEEVRAVTIDKLRLSSDSRVLDLGCGTGSVTVEIAGLVPDGMVYSYDISEEAVNLTCANVRKNKLPNVAVHKGSVPEALREDTFLQEGITHAFIGGNKGKLKDILGFLKDLCAGREKGDKIRVVLNVITEKTRNSLKAWIEENEVSEYGVVKVSVSRSDDMTPGNEVYIFSFVL